MSPESWVTTSFVFLNLLLPVLAGHAPIHNHANRQISLPTITKTVTATSYSDTTTVTSTYTPTVTVTTTASRTSTSTTTSLSSSSTTSSTSRFTTTNVVTSTVSSGTATTTVTSTPTVTVTVTLTTTSTTSRSSTITSTSTTTTTTTTTTTRTASCPTGSNFFLSAYNNPSVPNGSVGSIQGSPGDSQYLEFNTGEAASIFQLNSACGLFIVSDGVIANLDAGTNSGPVFFNTQAQVNSRGYQQCVCTISGPNNDLNCNCGSGANTLSLDAAGDVYISPAQAIPGGNNAVDIRAVFQ